LTLAIYRLSDRLPKDEAMREQLRKLSIEAVGDLIMGNYRLVQKKIDIFLAYFKICRAQKWVREINWLILENECLSLSHEAAILDHKREEEEKVPSVEKEKSLMSHNIKRGSLIPDNHEKPNGTSLRQKKILDELKLKRSVKMSDLIPLFKNTVSERTIRNDLQFLLKQDLINKKGARKTTTYFLE